MISVIIPAHNERENLTDLLPVLKHFSLKHEVEVLVCLSNSTNDGSDAIIRGKNINFLRCPKQGRAHQMNYGATSAKGNILVFLHADVRPPKGFFNDIKKSLAEGYDAGFFSYQFDNQSFFLKINAHFTRKKGIFTGGGDQCLFIKHDVFMTLGRFDESRVIMEDFAFFDQMKKAETPYKIVQNDLLVSARKYENNSYLRVNLTNLLLVILFKLGTPSHKLKSLHNRLLKMNYQNQSD